ncbi:ribokinase [Kribbella sp. NBC_01245]|uniref:ribokinase n=1 Tax=Kribbella sp. NBC_01245 TaxID=2903578 RepID=UPI002E280920|nr:ribokinase [Kribbella sp. NBC_01245]
MTAYDVAVLGSFMKDLVASAERRPLPGETLHGTGFAEFLGGKGVNQAVAAARMGASTAIVGTVGADRYGDEFLALLADHGVHTGRVLRHPRLGTGVGLPVVLPDGSNSIIIVSRANAAISTAQVEAAADVLTRCRVLSVQLELPVEASRTALRMAKAAGATTIFNPAPAGPVDAGLADVVDILVPNEVEAAELTGQSCDDEDALPRIARRLADEWDLQGCVITLGSRGVYLLDRSAGQEHRIGGHDVATIDTVGAGDAFCGSLAASIAAGASLLEAVELANAAGALSTTVSGAAASAPARTDALALLTRAAFPA